MEVAMLFMTLSRLSLVRTVDVDDGSWYCRWSVMFILMLVLPS